MSLINDMLRDLDARRGHPSAGAAAMLPVAGYPTGHATAVSRRRQAVLFALPLLAIGLPVLTDALGVFNWDGPGSAAMTASIAIPAPAARPARDQSVGRTGSRNPDSAGPATAVAPATRTQAQPEPVGTDTAAATPAPEATVDLDAGDIIVQRPAAGRAWRLAADTAASGRVEQAIGQLEEILANRDDHHQARLLLARLLSDRGQHKEAIARLEAAPPGAERNAGYRALLAGLYRQAGEPAVAVGHYSAALALAPDRGEWWTGLGIAEEQAGNRAGATTAYRRSLQYPLAPALRDYARQRLQQLAAPAGIAKSEPAGRT